MQHPYDMRRVLILGCSGSGKSTFARRLGALTGLHVVHLDQLYRQPGWLEPSQEQWLALLKRELEAEAWIMDGHMGSSLPLRLRAADTAIFFDFPTWICVRRVASRVWQGPARHGGRLPRADRSGFLEVYPGVSP
jgi:adenylate kinase family enzyme